MELLIIGKIGGTHHLKGAVKMYSNIGDEIHLLENNKVIAEMANGESLILTVKTVSHLLGEKWVVEFQEIRNKTDAGGLTKALIKARRDLLGIGEDEYLLNDLLQMEVIDINNGNIGKIINIFDTAAHEILEFESNEFQGMIPNIDEFVKKIDFKERKIYVETIDGMIEKK